MAVKYRADNIGSLLRPAELLEARAALREGRMDEPQVRAVEDRSILPAIEMEFRNSGDTIQISLNAPLCERRGLHILGSRRLTFQSSSGTYDSLASAYRARFERAQWLGRTVT